MTTSVVYAGTADGYIESGPATYATARAGSGTLTLNGGGTGVLYVGQLYDDYDTVYYVQEAFLGFDTSAIDDTDTVSAAVLNVTSNSDISTTDFTIQARLKDWSTTVTTADWVAGADLSGLTLLAHYATSGGFAANTAYDFTDDAMPANVSKTGVTRMLLCSDRTVSGTTPTGYEYVIVKPADTTGTTSDPKLTVTHAAGSTGPTWTTPADTVSISTTPSLAFTIPTAAAAQHFQMQLDTANTFDTGNLRDLNSHTDQTGWEYWDGAAWQAVPAGGVSTTYIGNDARHTVQTALSATTWYRRVRAGVA
jgi:hypothetical protein